MDWPAYYRDLITSGPRWLDYSNARIQVQTFGFVIEVAGELDGRRCLDVGCGRGQLAKAFADLGAASVTGLDVVAETIEALKKDRPEIDWVCGQYDSPSLDRAGSFDVITTVEVLQYLPDDSLQSIWPRLNAGGRLIGMIPNAACPIVMRTGERFDGYMSVDYTELVRRLEALDGLENWAIRPISFVEDQRLAPYAPGPWTTEPTWSSPPNRFQFVAVKQSA